MEEGLKEQTITSQPPNWLLIVATVLITGLIVGGGVYIIFNIVKKGHPFSFLNSTDYPHPDGGRVTEIRQIELALELYHKEHKEYPTNLKQLVKEGFISDASVLQDYRGEDFYNYAYGVDKGVDKVKYYHLGAVLREVSSLLDGDQDYNSTHDTPQVDWRPDSRNPGPCLTTNGFNGVDDDNCGLEGRAGVYDRGVVPE